MSKEAVVDKKFMMDLANRIYNPKTRKFLRLCDGKLQNGPDPTDAERPMHCGLGELYLAMTGHQPEEDVVGEDDVVEKAINLSPLNPEKVRDALLDTVVDGIQKLNLPSAVKAGLEDNAVDMINNMDYDEISEKTSEFKNILDEIPTSNDDKCGDSCKYETFLARSRRVAAKLRAAAKLLPE